MTRLLAHQYGGEGIRANCVCPGLTDTPMQGGALENPEFLAQVKYASIPAVSVLFTWWHVWLGMKMCFYPVEFKGCCYPVLGWQGIVPRRAGLMAARSCDIMVVY